MAQQSKITSRPLTKALGTASILGLAIAGANFANAIQTDFGVEYRADAFYIDGDAYGSSGSHDGLANLLRLKADFKDENTGISLHTSIQLAGDTWEGDSRTDGSASNGYNDEGNETVTLDTGYVQIPIAGNLLRIGRQETSWNNCLLVCDDRRDRIQAMFPTKVGTFVALYDRRLSSSDAVGDPFNNRGGDQTTLAYLTRLGGFNFGINWVHFFKNTGNDATTPEYAIQGAHIISPYISGSLTDGINLTVGAQWFGGNEENDENAFFGDGNVGPYEYGDGFSGYVRLDGDIGALNWGVQYLGAIDGGLIDRGFDTYFSTVNNNPAATGNPTSLISLGRGYGYQDYDQHLLAAKLGFDVTPRLNITGAVGYMKIDDGQEDVDDGSMIYDISATYKINESVTTVASIGLVGNNDAMVFSKAGGLIPHPGSAGNSFGIGAPTDFDDEDLVAANLGLRVKF